MGEKIDEGFVEFSVDDSGIDAGIEKLKKKGEEAASAVEKKIDQTLEGAVGRGLGQFQKFYNLADQAYGRINKLSAAVDLLASDGVSSFQKIDGLAHGVLGAVALIPGPIGGISAALNVGISLADGLLGKLFDDEQAAKRVQERIEAAAKVQRELKESITGSRSAEKTMFDRLFPLSAGDAGRAQTKGETDAAVDSVRKQTQEVGRLKALLSDLQSNRPAIDKGTGTRDLPTWFLAIRDAKHDLEQANVTLRGLEFRANSMKHFAEHFTDQPGAPRETDPLRRLMDLINPARGPQDPFEAILGGFTDAERKRIAFGAMGREPQSFDEYHKRQAMQQPGAAAKAASADQPFRAETFGIEQLNTRIQQAILDQIDDPIKKTIEAKAAEAEQREKQILEATTELKDLLKKMQDNKATFAD